MTASPLPAPSSGAKPSLKPLTHALSVLTPANYVLALKSAALHLQGRDADINNMVVHARLSKALSPGSSVKQLLQSCSRMQFLRRAPTFTCECVAAWRLTYANKSLRRDVVEGEHPQGECVFILLMHERIFGPHQRVPQKSTVAR